jgi:hypothetical protein
MSLWGNRDSKTAGGTAAIDVNGNVTGTSTFFTTQAKVGNYIRIAGEDYQIVRIAAADGANCVKVVPGVNGATMTAVSPAASYTLSEKPAYVAHEGRSPFGRAGDLGDSTKVYGVTTAELTAGGDSVVEIAVAIGGTGYVVAPAVTVADPTSGVTATATATISGGSVTRIAVDTVGSGYTSTPVVTVNSPRLVIDTTAVQPTNTDLITYNGHGLSVGEAVKYYNAGATTMGGLSDATTYYVASAGFTTNAFKIKAAATTTTITGVATVTDTTGKFSCTATTLAVGDRVTVTGTLGGASTGAIAAYATGTVYKVSAKTGTSPNVTAFTLTTEAGSAITTTVGTLVGLTFKGETVVDITGTGNITQYFDKIDKVAATAVADLGEGAVGGGHHAGWVRRIVGTGGRAGRVNYETLVAMGSVSGDQSDDIQFPDS